MKQNIMWLALTLLFALGVTLSMTAAPYRPAATVETTEPAPTVTHPIVTANVTPALPEVPVALLDDVPPRPTIGSQELARWIVAPPATRAAETTVASPPAPATTTTVAGQPWQDSKAGIKPLEGDARPTQQPKGGNAELPGKRLKGTANARACGSAPGRFADLLQRLKLAPRCTTRRSAA